MPTIGADRMFLMACAGSVGAGVVLVGIGCWLMPFRTLRQSWHKR